MRHSPARRTRAMALAIGLVLGTAACSERSADATGAVLFQRHCASCHGTGGRGDGPLAASLRTPPADLTAIAARREGGFDEADVMSAIDGRKDVTAHGPREMPVWGLVFEDALRGADAAYPGITALAQKRALAQYLRELQAPAPGR